MTAAEKLRLIQKSMRLFAADSYGMLTTPTPYELAKILDVAPSTVYRWERGQAVPRGGRARRLHTLYLAAKYVRQSELAKQFLCLARAFESASVDWLIVSDGLPMHKLSTRGEGVDHD